MRIEEPLRRSKPVLVGNLRAFKNSFNVLEPDCFATIAAASLASNTFVMLDFIVGVLYDPSVPERVELPRRLLLTSTKARSNL